MGNSSSYEKFPKQLKMATIAESMMQYNARKFEGCGDTVEEALEQLTKICKCYYIPEPKPIPDTKDSYYCGIISVLNVLKTEKKYNTVWFNQRSGKHIAFIYYTDF